MKNKLSMEFEYRFVEKSIHRTAPCVCEMSGKSHKTPQTHSEFCRLFSLQLNADIYFTNPWIYISEEMLCAFK